MRACRGSKSGWALACTWVSKACLSLDSIWKRMMRKLKMLLLMRACNPPNQPTLGTGWAIEGAIGSEYKIDASYLSPHVNMASRLEAATKQYGVTVLLSDAFVAMLSPRVAARVRQVDCVTVKGSQQPVGLYTYDTSTDGLDVWTDLAKKTAKVGWRLRREGPGCRYAGTGCCMACDADGASVQGHMPACPLPE